MEPYRTRSVRIPEPYLRFEREIRARERHIDIVVVSWVVMGIFHVLYGLGLSALIIVGAGSLKDNDPALRIVMPVFAVTVLLACIGMSVWFLLTAWGLHRRRRFARISSYILASLLAATVFLLPLSLYAFWVLVGNIADMAFGRFQTTSAEHELPEPPQLPSRPPWQASPRLADGEKRPAPRPVERKRRPTGPREVVVVPPESKPYRVRTDTYPRPEVALRTPPAGVPRYVGESSNEKAGQDYSSMETVKEIPAPLSKKK